MIIKPTEDVRVDTNNTTQYNSFRNKLYKNDPDKLKELDKKLKLDTYGDVFGKEVVKSEELELTRPKLERPKIDRFKGISTNDTKDAVEIAKIKIEKPKLENTFKTSFVAIQRTELQPQLQVETRHSVGAGQSASHLIADEIIFRQINLDRYAESVNSDAFFIMDRVSKEMAEQVFDDAQKLNQLGYSFTNKQRTILINKLRRFDKFIAGLTDKLHNQELSWVKQVFSKVLIPEVVGDVGKKNFIPLQDIKINGNDMKNYISDLHIKTGSILKKEIDSFKTISSLKEVDKRKWLRFFNKTMKKNRNSLDAIVRTSIMGTSQQARKGFYESNNNLFDSYYHISVLDGSTSSQCIARANKQWNKNYKPINHSIIYLDTPVHFNCRSSIGTRIRQWDDWEREALGNNRKVANGKGQMVDVSKGKYDGLRQAVDRPFNLKPNDSYGDFLKTKSKAFQIDVLGQKRWELWNSGKLDDLSKLINQRGRPLRLDELYKVING